MWVRPGAYPKVLLSESGLTQAGLTPKHYTWLEKTAMDKHSRLLRKFVNYKREKLYNNGPMSA
jgi:hypothetical protein